MTALIKQPFVVFNDIKPNRTDKQINRQTQSNRTNKEITAMDSTIFHPAWQSKSQINTVKQLIIFLKLIKIKITEVVSQKFDSVLLNQYQDLFLNTFERT